MSLSLESVPWIAGIGVIAACWRSCLSFLGRVRSFFVVKTVLRGDVNMAVAAYCNKHFRRSPFSDGIVFSTGAFVRPLSRVQEVAWQGLPAGQSAVVVEPGAEVGEKGGGGHVGRTRRAGPG